MKSEQSCGSLYDRIVKYHISAECREPLHVGSGDREYGEVLIHPVEARPFLQATGIAGAFREYFSANNRLAPLCGELFGAADQGEGAAGSRIRFSDGNFRKSAVYTELRPRVRIDAATGTCRSESVKGSGAVSGQKFEMESVSAGSEFSFDIYVYEKDTSYQDAVEAALAALEAGSIQLGGQKSNGCGYVKLLSVGKACYDMTDPGERHLWIKEEKAYEDILPGLIREAERQDERIHFVLSGKTEGPVLVRSISVSEYGPGAPDAENIVNRRKQYILPASSVKGVIRSHIERIAAFRHLDEGIIEDMFGTASEDEQEGTVGIVGCFDSEIGNTADNDAVRPQARIHIDKFTGGVMNAALFSEKPAYGNISVRIDLKEEKAEAIALLLFALRDLGLGIFPVGSGSSIGRGYLKGETLTVSRGGETLIDIDLAGRSFRRGRKAAESYLRSLG